jgi:hypothetical protein
MKAARTLLPVGRWLSDASAEDLMGVVSKAWPSQLVADRTVPAERSAELHADLLSATWLGLYFLGVPFNEPWERARRLIEAAGGFPHGACINKAIGDVYRWARRKLEREYGVPASCGAAGDGAGALAASNATPAALIPQYGLVVYTRRPLALLPLAHWESARTVSHNNIAALGRCYALMQLRLYVESGLPFAYIVPEDVIRSAMASKATASSVAQWVRQTVGATPRPGQALLVSSPNPASDGMPTCVLAPTRGLTTLEGLPSDGHDYGISFAGQRVGSALTESYRIRLRQFNTRQLMWSDEASLERALSGLVHSRDDKTV